VRSPAHSVGCPMRRFSVTRTNFGYVEPKRTIFSTGAVHVVATASFSRGGFQRKLVALYKSVGICRSNTLRLGQLRLLIEPLTFAKRRMARNGVHQGQAGHSRLDKAAG